MSIQRIAVCRSHTDAAKRYVIVRLPVGGWQCSCPAWTTGLFCSNCGERVRAGKFTCRCLARWLDVRPVRKDCKHIQSIRKAESAPARAAEVLLNDGIELTETGAAWLCTVNAQAEADAATEVLMGETSDLCAEPGCYGERLPGKPTCERHTPKPALSPDEMDREYEREMRVREREQRKTYSERMADAIVSSLWQMPQEVEALVRGAVADAVRRCVWQPPTQDDLDGDPLLRNT